MEIDYSTLNFDAIAASPAIYYNLFDNRAGYLD